VLRRELEYVRDDAAGQCQALDARRRQNECHAQAMAEVERQLAACQEFLKQAEGSAVLRDQLPVLEDRVGRLQLSYAVICEMNPSAVSAPVSAKLARLQAHLAQLRRLATIPEEDESEGDEYGVAAAVVECGRLVGLGELQRSLAPASPNANRLPDVELPPAQVICLTTTAAAESNIARCC